MIMAPDQRNVKSVISDRSHECHATFGEKKTILIMVIGLSGVQYSVYLTKTDDCERGFQFVNHEYDYRLNWMTRCPVTN